MLQRQVQDEAHFYLHLRPAVVKHQSKIRYIFYGCDIFCHQFFIINLFFSRSFLNTSSFYNQSILQTSHVLEETENHLVEAFGATLPVAITEILTLSESE